jgi:CRISPR/Cas system-associated exonuclease Cas4 (RecB family)
MSDQLAFLNDIPVQAAPPMPPKEVTYSASQISTFRLCKRRWYYEKIAKLPQPIKPGTELGTKMHALLEEFEKSGKRVDEPILEHVWDSDLMQSVLKLAHTGELVIEGECTFVMNGKRVNGRIDLSWREGRTVYILDHKTTKDFRYAKKPDEALSDPQTLVYAHWAFQDPEVDTVIFIYHYIRTVKPTHPRVVRIQHSRESISPLLVEMDADMDEMAALRNQPEIASEQNTNSCWAFGGCPFRERCFSVSMTGTIGQMMAQTNTSSSTESAMNSNDVDSFLSGLPVPAPSAQNAPAVAPSKPSVPAATAPETPKVTEPTTAPAQAPEKPKSAGGLKLGSQIPQQTDTPAPAASPKAETRTPAPASGLPIVIFGGHICDEGCVTLEEFAQPFIDEYTNGPGKGAHYLTVEFNKAERVIAVNTMVAIYAGKVKLPSVLVVDRESVLGRFFRCEARYLKGIARVIVADR